MKPITSPATLAVGDDITAALLNSDKTAIDAIVAREGARVTTNTVQAIAANTSTALNNGGVAGWGLNEDSGSFYNNAGGTTVPLSIPAGKGGLYVVGGFVLLSGVSAGTLWVAPLVNGTGNVHAQWPNWTGDRTGGVMVLPLNAGDTLGLQVRIATALNASVGSELYCYRIGN